MFFSLKEGVESFHEYMWGLTNHEVNPLIVPSLEQLCILLDIQHNIHLHPWLALPDDPNDNIWAYYHIMQVSPIMMEGFLIIILLIPLVDKSLQMDLYKVYNLPALYPDLKAQFSYVVEGDYLAISMSCMYATMPTSHKFHICLASQGHLCVLNTALYPVEKIEWCVYALFIRNQDLVREHCLIDLHIWHANLILNLDGSIWELSSLASDRIQVCCVEETHLEPIVPPLTLNYIGNGCEGYSTNIYIPSKSDLTSKIDTSSRYEFFCWF